jgi:hypothetical protein
MNTARRNANLAAIGAAIAAIALYRFPSQEHGFYPACPIYRYLHLYCPGCGSTRALSALLHGRLMEALHYNPLFVALLPLLVAFALVAYWNAIARDETRWPRIPTPVLSALLAVAAVFTIVRNL